MQLTTVRYHPKPPEPLQKIRLTAPVITEPLFLLMEIWYKAGGGRGLKREALRLSAGVESLGQVHNRGRRSSHRCHGCEINRHAVVRTLAQPVVPSTSAISGHVGQGKPIGFNGTIEDSKPRWPTVPVLQLPIRP